MIRSMASPIPTYVIDDDPAMVESTRFLLESLGCEADGFVDPLDFLQSLRKLEPGCVLSDFAMPSMTGAELHSALRQRGIDWPVILMSGNRNRAFTRRLVGDGIIGFLEKPFTVEQLTGLLERAAEKLDCASRANQPERSSGRKM
jgi:FixJ family two-component response regulator